jgi:cytochrome c553
MKKNLLLVLLLPALWISLILPALSQEDMEVIENEGFSKRQRPPAVFKHDEHNEKAEIDECNECHHVYESGERLEDESSEDQSCSDCHSEKGADDRPRLIKAFHLN